MFGIFTLPIGSMYVIYGNIYHQYTPVMLASIYHTWILWVINGDESSWVRVIQLADESSWICWCDERLGTCCWNNRGRVPLPRTPVRHHVLHEKHGNIFGVYPSFRWSQINQCWFHGRLWCDSKKLQLQSSKFSRFHAVWDPSLRRQQ